MGNVERILVVVIMATIVVILALAIWGLGQDEAGAPPGGAASSAIEADRELPVTFDSGGAAGPPADDDSADGALDAVIPVDAGRGSAEQKAPVQPIATVADGPPIEASATSATSKKTPASDPARFSAPPPSSGAPLESPIAGMRLYTVAAGDTFSTIAFKVLGDRNEWKQIAEANKDVDPRKLTLGMQILVPARGAEKAAIVKTPASAEPSSTAAPAPVPPLLATNPAATGGKRYVTKKGDTLYGIAKREMQDGSKWRSIYEANRTVLPSEKVVPVGLTLEIPASSR